MGRRPLKPPKPENERELMFLMMSPELAADLIKQTEETPAPKPTRLQEIFQQEVSHAKKVP